MSKVKVCTRDIVGAIAELAETVAGLELRLLKLETELAVEGAGIPWTGEVGTGPLPDGPGVVFDKHALTAGKSFPDPRGGGTLTLSVKDLDRMVANFCRKVAGPVPVQLAGRHGEHTDDPLRGAGEVIGVRREGKKLITRLDVRDPGTADRIRRKLILGSSLGLHLDYEKSFLDSDAGDCGPVIVHQVLCQRPRLTYLDPFTEVTEAITRS